MRVSIVLYVFNGGTHLTHALRSIQAQTHPAFELCVVDDGSTDETPRLLCEAAAADKRIRVERQEHLGSEGLHETFNHALAMTRHDLIAIANADDVWLPHKLECQVRAFATDPALDICFHDATFIDDLGRIRHGGFRRVPSENPSPTPRPWQFVAGNPIPNPTAMFHRSILRRIGLQEVGQMHDHQFWLKACIHGCRFHGLPDRLIRYRVHELSQSTATHRKEHIRTMHRECAEMMVDRYGLERIYPELAAVGSDPDSHAWAWNHLGALYWKSDNVRAAEHAWSQALRYADNPAIVANLGLAALVRGNRHRAMQLLTVAVRGGDGQAQVLLDRPELARDLSPQLWVGTPPALPHLLEESPLAPPSPSPRPHTPPPHGHLVLHASHVDPDRLCARLADIVDVRGVAPTSLVVIATAESVIGDVVRAHEQLESGAPHLAAALDVEVVLVSPGEAASVAEAHVMEGSYEYGFLPTGHHAGGSPREAPMGSPVGASRS